MRRRKFLKVLLATAAIPSLPLSSLSVCAKTPDKKPVFFAGIHMGYISSYDMKTFRWEVSNDVWFASSRILASWTHACEINYDSISHAGRYLRFNSDTGGPSLNYIDLGTT